MWNIMEQPWTLLVIAFIVFLILAMTKYSLPDKYRYIYWLVPVLIAILSFGLDYFVDTDAELIRQTIKSAVIAVENEQPEDIDSVISNDYGDSIHKSKSEIMTKCHRYLHSPFIDNVIYSISELEINNDQASLLMLNRVFFEAGSEYSQAGIITNEFRIFLVKKQNKQWLIKKAELASLNTSPATWKDFNKLQNMF